MHAALCKVSEWIQRILNIGAAFAGADGAKGLCGLLTAQAENFFRCTQLPHVAHLCLKRETELLQDTHSLYQSTCRMRAGCAAATLS